MSDECQICHEHALECICKSVGFERKPVDIKQKTYGMIWKFPFAQFEIIQSAETGIEFFSHITRMDIIIFSELS